MHRLRVDDRLRHRKPQTAEGVFRFATVACVVVIGLCGGGALAQDEPPPMVEPPAADDAPDPASDPATTTTPAYTPPPPPPTPAPAPDQPSTEALVPPAQPQSSSPQGLDPFMTGVVQTGAGTGIALAGYGASIGLNALAQAAPGAAPAVAGVSLGLNVWQCCAMPGVVGWVVTLLGDMLGQQRAGALGPIIGGYGGCVLGGLVSVGVTVALLAAVVGGLASNPLGVLALLLNPAASGVVLAIIISVNVLNAIIIGATPAVVYAISAENKKPGDTGEGMPGFTAPNHPVVALPSAAVAGNRAMAMAY